MTLEFQNYTRHDVWALESHTQGDSGSTGFAILSWVPHSHRAQLSQRTRVCNLTVLACPQLMADTALQAGCLPRVPGFLARGNSVQEMSQESLPPWSPLVWHSDQLPLGVGSLRLPPGGHSCAIWSRSLAGKSPVLNNTFSPNEDIRQVAEAAWAPAWVGPG